jgi:dolichol kinase
MIFDIIEQCATEPDKKQRMLHRAKLGGALLGAPAALIGFLIFIVLAPSGLTGWAALSLVLLTMCGSSVGALIAAKVVSHHDKTDDLPSKSK